MEGLNGIDLEVSIDTTNRVFIDTSYRYFQYYSIIILQCSYILGCYIVSSIKYHLLIGRIKVNTLIYIYV